MNTCQHKVLALPTLPVTVAVPSITVLAFTVDASPHRPFRPSPSWHSQSTRHHTARDHASTVNDKRVTQGTGGVVTRRL